MFYNENYGVNIYADLDNTVIHATLRNCDLIPAFLNVIRDTPEASEIAMKAYDDNLYAFVLNPDADDSDPQWESEEITEWLNEQLWDIIDSYAPEGYYFGAHPGDGSDFGYWQNDDFID